MKKPRIIKKINNDWLFYYEPSVKFNEEQASIKLNEDKYYAVALPHTWHTYETTGQIHPFIKNPAESDNTYWWYGWGWYRKRIKIDESLRGKRIFIECDGANKIAKVYCNGNFVGIHRGAFTGFSFELTDFIRWGEDNIIAIAVSARRDDLFGGIAPMTAGNWNMYGGVYRDVRLVITNNVYIPFQGSADYDGGLFIRTPQACKERARVIVDTHVRNASDLDKEITIEHKIIDKSGNLVDKLEGTFFLPAGRQECYRLAGSMLENPHLWSDKEPYLYQLETKIYEGEEFLDFIENHFGIRDIRWDWEKNRLILNGEPVWLNGFNRHQEYPWLGDAVPKWIHERDLMDIRYNLNQNFARWAHYPHDPFVYEWCSRNGLMVMIEVPNIKEYVFDRKNQKEQVLETIRRFRNEPCVVFWSMGNETPYPADMRWAAAEDDTRIIHSKATREMKKGNQFALDNYYEAPGEHYEKQMSPEIGAGCFVRGWFCNELVKQEKIEKKIKSGVKTTGQISDTELAAVYNIIKEYTGTPLNQSNKCMWIYADHGCDREYQKCPLLHFNPKGWVDHNRQKKYIWHMWKANFSPELSVYITPHWWQPEYIGQSRKVVIFSNGEKVEVFTGDELVKVVEPKAESLYTVELELVVVDKPLRAVAYRGNEKVEYSLPMRQEPFALSLSVEYNNLVADRSGIALVIADIVDKNSNSIFGADNPIKWDISGPGILLAPEEFISQRWKKYESEGTFYTVTPVVMPVRTTDKAGKITVTASSPGLNSAQISFEVKSPEEETVEGIFEYSAPRGNLNEKERSAIEGKREDTPVPIHTIYDGVQFSKTGTMESYIKEIREYIGERPLQSDSETVNTLLNNLAKLAYENKGWINSIDYNRLVQEYNDLFFKTE